MERQVMRQVKSRIFYQIFVRSFYDSNNDGIGDINGIISKLNYLQNLGIDGIWLMPVHPSPSYHKYDVTDYYNIDSEYGTLADFKRLLKEAHQRDIKIIIDFVVSHTSSRHPWFLDAQKNLNSPFRNYFNWKDGQGFEHKQGWYSIANVEEDTLSSQQYFGHFSSEMPDLNYDCPKVRQEVIKIGKFWVGEIGVDGFRLDAAQHIYPNNQHKKNCEWWKQFRVEMEAVNKNVFLVGEVWSESEIAAPYLDKALHAVFNFDIGYKIMKVVRIGKDSGIAVRHKQIRDLYSKYSKSYVDATFITNHDQNRIMSGVKKNIDKAKMAASLLLTLPGSPFIYYGEELGMQGKKPDEYIREPFIWDNKKTDKGQTKWIRVKYNKGLVSLARQMEDKKSIWNHYKTLIQLRKSNELLSFGEIEPLLLKDKKLIVFYRILKDEALLIIHNPCNEDIECDIGLLNKTGFHFYFKSNKKCSIKETILTIFKFSTVIFE